MSYSTKDRRGGFYWIDGEPHISVTNVLKVINKGSALRYWFGKQIYLAMCEDPTLDQKEAMAAPYKKSDKAKKRGTTVHSIIEHWKAQQETLDGIPEPYEGYTDAFYAWINDNKVNILENEKTVVNKRFKYAGTADLIVNLNGNKEKIVVDVKTNKKGNVYDEAHLQVSAYMNAIGAKRGFVLALSEKGKYTFKEVDYDFEAFLAAKKLWEWKNRDDCLTVGYLKEDK